MSPVPKPPIQDPDPALPAGPQDVPIDSPIDPPIDLPQDGPTPDHITPDPEHERMADPEAERYTHFSIDAGTAPSPLDTP